eukprot:1155415-Pelagomonas_calceolata.AAC.1
MSLRTFDSLQVAGHGVRKGEACSGRSCENKWICFSSHIPRNRSIARSGKITATCLATPFANSAHLGKLIGRIHVLYGKYSCSKTQGEAHMRFLALMYIFTEREEKMRKMGEMLRRQMKLSLHQIKKRRHIGSEKPRVPSTTNLNFKAANRKC